MSSQNVFDTASSRWPVLALLGSLLLAACGDSGSSPEAAEDLSFANTGDDCRNFLIISPVTRENARRFVPPEFTLVEPPTAFVELADCAGGSLDGVDTGPYRIAEAAVFITPPDGGSFPPLLINSAIYLLWQLDTNEALSARKRAIGFFGETVPGIEIDVTSNGLLGVDGLALTARGEADVPYAHSPYRLEATLTGNSPPAVPLLNSLWHLGPQGVINTINDIYETRQILAGVGTITVPEGSPLHQLFGRTRITGVAAAGIGSFVNTTELRPDILASAPP